MYFLQNLLSCACAVSGYPILVGTLVGILRKASYDACLETMVRFLARTLRILDFHHCLSDALHCCAKIHCDLDRVCA